MSLVSMISVIALTGTVLLAADGKSREFRFKKDDVGKVPAGWKSDKTGSGEGSVWKVVEDNTALENGSRAGPDRREPQQRFQSMRGRRHEIQGRRDHRRV